MPVMDGLASSRELRKRGIRAPIVAVTASIDRQNQAQCTDAGMTDFLAKPITKGVVHKLLSKYLM